MAQTAAIPPAIIFSPQIIVPPAPPSLVPVWLPVLVAILSAAIAGFSAWLAWRNQVVGFAKDIAAVRRDTASKQATMALLAFENSVARPVGQSLDMVERLSVELGKLNRIEQAPAREAALEQYGRGMMADYSHGRRLCREADDALQKPRQAVFVRVLVEPELDSKLLAAASDQLTPGAGQASYDAVADAVVALKVKLRQVLEAERAAEGQRWQDSLADDPFIAQAEQMLPRFLRRSAN